ncbi:hypothetical protein V5799_033083 [Amblyomma americanum]|uniref:Uncharacterized protein n=1 Tax=Amblyomma americanum TaxID=6943 RepID=A0AAQ4DPB8_AMBAM
MADLKSAITSAVHKLVDPKWRGAVSAVRDYVDLTSAEMSDADKESVLKDLGVKTTLAAMKDKKGEVLSELQSLIRSSTPWQLLGIDSNSNGAADGGGDNNNNFKREYEEAVKGKNGGPVARKTIFDFINEKYPVAPAAPAASAAPAPPAPSSPAPAPPVSEPSQVSAQASAQVPVQVPERVPEQVPTKRRALFAVNVTAYDDCVKRLSTLILPDLNPNNYTVFDVPLQEVKAPALSFPTAAAESNAAERVAEIKTVVLAKIRGSTGGDVTFKWPFADHSRLSWFAVLRNTKHLDSHKENVNVLCTCSSNPDDEIDVTYLSSRILAPGLLLANSKYRTVGYERKRHREEEETTSDDSNGRDDSNDSDDNSMQEEEEDAIYADVLKVLEEMTTVGSE